MAQTVKTSVPAQIVAGDSTKWQITLADYPASDGWVLNYTLNILGNTINISSAAAGDDHLIDIAAAATSAYIAGDYQYVAYVNGVGDERHTIENGAIAVKPNLAAATAGFDGRSPAKKCLDDLNAALATYGNKAYTQEYSIAGRTMKFSTPVSFMDFRNKVKAEVARETAAENIKLGKPVNSKIRVRF